jgi:hypothetical protein
MKKRKKLNNNEIRIRAAFARLRTEADICDKYQWMEKRCRERKKDCLIMKNMLCDYYDKEVARHCGRYSKFPISNPKEDISLIKELTNGRGQG